MADIDSYIRMLGVTILSPAVLSICVLSLRAVGLDWADTSLRVTIAMFLLSGLARVLSTLNHRLVNGPPRKVIWDQEVVVITGGGSGLGLLLAEVYGLKGCSVAVIDVNETASGIVRNMGDEVRFYHCDITDPARLGEVAVRIEQDIGCPSILINNAARVRPCLISEAQGDPSVATDCMKGEIAVNFQGALNVLGTFLPRIMTAKGGGHIVTVSSVLGIFGPVGLAGYAASKAALSIVHQSLQAELRFLGRTDVKTSHVLLGQMDTPMFRTLETPNRLVAPIVKAKDVCHAIVEMVDRGRGGDIFFPLYANCANIWPTLPGSMQILLRWWSGIDAAATQGMIPPTKPKTKMTVFAAHHRMQT